MEVRAERLESSAPSRRKEAAARVGAAERRGLPSPFRRRDSNDTEYCLINLEGIQVFI